MIGGVTSYLRALTELFDASVTDIVEAAQPRTFDREGIRVAADIWHNNVLDLYARRVGPDATGTGGPGSRNAGTDGHSPAWSPELVSAARRT